MDGAVGEESGEGEEDEDFADAGVDEPEWGFVTLGLKRDDGIIFFGDVKIFECFG